MANDQTIVKFYDKPPKNVQERILFAVAQNEHVPMYNYNTNENEFHIIKIHSAKPI